MPRKRTAPSGAASARTSAAAIASSTSPPKPPERLRRKICFYFNDLSLVKLAEGGLAVLPAPLEPISRETVMKEATLGGDTASVGVEGLVGPLRIAHEEGRLLMGWSRWRSKDRVLTWKRWDEFVEKWCGTTAHRSPDRGDVLEPEVLYKEVARLQELKLVTVAGEIPGKPAAEPVEKKSRGRRRVTTIETNDDEDDGAAGEDDE